MNTKLTLTLDDRVIKKAKKYASKERVSLSRLVEFFFKSLTSDSTKKTDILPPITSELSGMLKNVKITNYKKELEKALVDKYL